MTGNLEIQAALVCSSEDDPELEKHFPETSTTVREKKRKRKLAEYLFMLCKVLIFHNSPEF